MPDTTLSVGFNVPFDEAIAAMDAREIVLPAKYYGELQGIQRQLAFSIAGVASLDQLQAVLNSLFAKLANGQSFEQWQDSVAVRDLGLPKHRLDNIYRTNIQNAYNRGHWEQFKQNEVYQPYLMYDAINDSRTRPSHRALDGIIRRIDDPFWDTHYPANGYRCRCSVVSLSESQAQARSKGDNGLNKKIDLDSIKPDKGWDYNCGSDITEGINKAIADRLAKAAAKTVEPKLAKSLKKKVVVPKDDVLHVDNIVAKTPVDAPKTTKTSTSKLASKTPQTNSAAKAWSKEHIDKVQKTFPYKFQDGVFNPDLVKTGDKIKNPKTGETWQWDDEKKEIVADSHKEPKAALKKTSKASNVAQPDKPTKEPTSNTEKRTHTRSSRVDAAIIARRENATKLTTEEQQAKMDKTLKSFFGEKYRKEQDFVNNAKLAKEVYGLSVPEHEAIYTYTGALHGRLNEQMGFRLPDGIAHKADVLEGYGDVLSQALKKMPINKGKVLRAVSLPHEVIDSYVVGEQRLEVEFWSTTHAGHHVFSGNVHFEIKSKTGRNIEDLSKYSDDEMETLFDRNTTFKVISKKLVNKENDQLNGAWQIELEEV